MCNIHLLYKTGALRVGSLDDYDREAKALFGISDIEAACNKLTRRTTVIP
jgi:hypothetical protein